MEVRITDLFDLGKIVDSGQCFRAALLPEGDYRFITGGQVLYIQKCAEETYRVSCDRESWERVWVPYFDLNRSYRDISGQIPEKDTFLRLAAQAGAGIRILRQDPWETLVTFILSQRKSIPAIRAMVELLSQRYGTALQTPHGTLYTFPTAQQLERAGLEDYIACKAGYRAPYLCDAVCQVLSGRLDLERIAALPDGALIDALEGVRGVGVKRPCGRTMKPCRAIFLTICSRSCRSLASTPTNSPAGATSPRAFKCFPISRRCRSLSGR